MEGFGNATSTWSLPYPQLRSLAPHLHLFARKFAPEAADSLLRLYKENDGGGEKLGILGGLF